MYVHALRLRRFVVTFYMATFTSQYPAGEEDSGLPIHRLVSLCHYSVRSSRTLSVCLVSRAAFLNAIIGISDMKIAHLNKRCISIEHTSSSEFGSTLLFSDGTSHCAHLVIGADGIKSTIRKFVVDPLANGAENDNIRTNLVFSGSSAYRGLLPNSTVVASGVKIDLKVQPVCFCGIDRVCRFFLDVYIANAVAPAYYHVPNPGRSNRAYP